MKKLIYNLSGLIIFLLLTVSVSAQEASPAKKSSPKNSPIHGSVVAGQLTAVNGKTLTVSKDNQNYQVVMGTNTKLRRRFWGKAEFADFSLNDTISVYGNWADEAKISMEANLIRDLSILKHQGVFFGLVSTLEGQNFVINTDLRGDANVSLATNTSKVVNRKMEAMKATDLKIGDLVRIKGFWDTTSNSITQVTQVKDFSQPLATPSASVLPKP